MVKSRIASSWPVLLILVAILSSAGLLAWSALGSPKTAFLPAASPAHWIVYPVPGDIHLNCSFEVDTVFTRTFHLDALPPHATLHVRALRSCRVLLNDHPLVLHGFAPLWKREATADALADLRLGDNQITATVTNGTGPPALWLWLECPGGGGESGCLGGGAVVSDATWDSSCAGAAVHRAIFADDPIFGRTYDPLYEAHSVAQALPLVWPRLRLFFLVAVVLVLLGRLGLGRRELAPAIFQRKWRRLLLAALLLAATLWSALFIHNLPWLADSDGFDATAHLNYIQFVQTHHAIPLANQGWEMYQAPLYYVLSALMLSGAGIFPHAHVFPPAGVIVLRGLNLFLGVVNLCFLIACLRLIFPRHPRRQLIGFIVGAALPMQLYLFQFPTNEVLATTAATAVAFLCLRALSDPCWRVWDYLLLGLGLGAALLAKVSGFLLIVPVIAAMTTRIFQPVEPSPPSSSPSAKPSPCRFSQFQAVASIVLPLLVALALSGWYYGRVWAYFGTPIVGNWSVASGMLWWQDPGFRTFAAYARFGRALHQPIYAGFNSVWDGLYSTLWGDAFCAGNRMISCPPWSYDLIVIGAVLALLPTLAILVGAVAAAMGFIRKPTPAWVFLLGLAFTVLLAIISMTLTVPSYAQAKAFYGLVAFVPLCALAGLGLDLLGGHWPLWRGLLLVGLLTWALTALAAYWTDPTDPRVLISLAFKSDKNGRLDAAIAQAQLALTLDPNNPACRLALIHFLRSRNPNDPEIDRLLAAFPAAGPATSVALGSHGSDAFNAGVRNAEAAAQHLQAWHRLANQGDAAGAIAQIQLAARLDPDSFDILDIYNTAAAMNRSAGRLDQAIACLREALRLSPYQPLFHAELADLYTMTQQFDLANQQRIYAQRADQARSAFFDHIDSK